MLRAFQFECAMRPVPKERPRFTNGRAYTSTRTRTFEQAIAYACKKRMAELNIPSFGDLNVAMDIQFNYATPKWRGKDFYRGKSDIDNLLKSVLDGLNKIIFNDDRQVVRIIAEKRCAAEDKIIVKVEAV